MSNVRHAQVVKKHIRIRNAIAKETEIIGQHLHIPTVPRVENVIDRIIAGKGIHLVEAGNGNANVIGQKATSHKDRMVMTDKTISKTIKVRIATINRETIMVKMTDHPMVNKESTIKLLNTAKIRLYCTSINVKLALICIPRG